jgi:hypothetical protein
VALLNFDSFSTEKEWMDGMHKVDAEINTVTTQDDDALASNVINEKNKPLISRSIERENEPMDAQEDAKSNAPSAGEQLQPTPSAAEPDSSITPFDRNEITNQIKEAPVVADICHHLLKAFRTAKHFGRDRWDFAIEVSQLQDLGAHSHTIRKMVCSGWIEHRREIPSLKERKFIPEEDVVLHANSCFVVTDKGLPLLHYAAMTFPETAHNMLFSRPSWDADAREFRLGDQLVKQFRWKAINQERVLEAFAQANWPTTIGDPLPVHPDICAKQRLHDTIKCLNRKHINGGLVKFRGDGTGRGVVLDILVGKKTNTSFGLEG